MSDAPSQPTPLYLASTSPRRGQLLADRGYRFEQRSPRFDDTGVTLDGAAPHRAAEALAYLKATSVADTLDAGVVIGCDTVVVQGDRVFGKPADLADARRMLDALIDNEHQVTTGVSLADAGDGRIELFQATARVQLGRVPRRELEEYLNGGMWVGKAGGYNLAELERRWPFRVAGDPTTVVGLPVEAVGERLAAMAQ